jgi:hypothetical protein
MNKQALSRDKAKEKNTQGFDQRIHEFAPVLLAALVGERFSRVEKLASWNNACVVGKRRTQVPRRARSAEHHLSLLI